MTTLPEKPAPAMSWLAIRNAIESALTDRKLQAAVNLYLSDTDSLTTIREQIIEDIRCELMPHAEQRINVR